MPSVLLYFLLTVITSKEIKEQVKSKSAALKHDKSTILKFTISFK